MPGLPRATRLSCGRLVPLREARHRRLDSSCLTVNLIDRWCVYEGGYTDEEIIGVAELQIRPYVAVDAIRHCRTMRCIASSRRGCSPVWSRNIYETTNIAGCRAGARREEERVAG